jgi:hypothetical protein
MQPRAYVTTSDYMDVDVSYLLGMLFGRGQLIEEGDVRRLVITLSIRRTLPKLPPGVAPIDLDLDRENERALNGVRARINELLDANVDIVRIAKGATLTAKFVKRTIAWRDIKILCSGGDDRSNFRLPNAFFQFSPEIRKEFIRGFGDAAVTPSWADNERNMYARIAFPVVHANLRFAKQLQRLLKGLGSEPQFLAGSPRTRRGKREHRIRMRAEKYADIGFTFQHKNRLLQLLADFNRQR